jgi:Ser/Thr protein kinase RdoA (MazF antagonist)
MSTLSPALEAISMDPPAVEVTAVAEAVARQFGLQGRYELLVSERDQNFHLHADDGREYVIKVVSSGEEAIATDFQIALLRHLQDAGDIIAPQVVPTLSGDRYSEIAWADTCYRLRAVTWVAGEPLESRPLDAVRAGQFGVALARLDKVLQGFKYPGEGTVLAWDLQRVAELRDLVENIDESETLAAVSSAIDDYENRVIPVKQELRSQVIHGDANLGNVLATGDQCAFIDFGDCVKAHRVFDLAIAAAYLRSEGDDPLALIVPFVAGYQSIARLEALERDLLFDLVRARLAPIDRRRSNSKMGLQDFCTGSTLWDAKISKKNSLIHNKLEQSTLRPRQSVCHLCEKLTI